MEENKTEETKEEFKRDFAPHRKCSIRICKECGEVYIVSDTDMIYSIKTYGTVPLLCKRCRSKKKAAMGEDTVVKETNSMEE